MNKLPAYLFFAFIWTVILIVIVEWISIDVPLTRLGIVSAFLVWGKGIWLLIKLAIALDRD